MEVILSALANAPAQQPCSFCARSRASPPIRGLSCSCSLGSGSCPSPLTRAFYLHCNPSLPFGLVYFYSIPKQYPGCTSSRIVGQCGGPFLDHDLALASLDFGFEQCDGQRGNPESSKLRWFSSHPLVGWTSAHARVRAAGWAPGGTRASGFGAGSARGQACGARGGRQGAAERELRRLDALAWARQLRSGLQAPFSVRRVI